MEQQWQCGWIGKQDNKTTKRTAQTKGPTAFLALLKWMMMIMMMVLIIIMFSYSLIIKERRYRENISISQSQQTRNTKKIPWKFFSLQRILQEFSIQTILLAILQKIFPIGKTFLLLSLFYFYRIILRGLCKIRNYKGTRSQRRIYHHGWTKKMKS